MTANLYSLFSARFAHRVEQPCIETESGSVYTYGDIDRETARLAQFLTDLGVEKGSRIAVQVEKSPATIWLYLAVLRAGFVYLPLNTAYQRTELEYFLRDAEPALVVCAPPSEKLFAELAKAVRLKHIYTLDENGDGSLIDASRTAGAESVVADVAEDDLAAIVYTSGTTGRSKGAMLTHGNLSSNAQTLHTYWGFQPNDVLLHTLPLFHVHGLFVAVNVCLLNAGKMILLPKFDAETVIACLARSTVFMGVPTYYTRLLARSDFDRDVCRNMRLFTSGSAPLLNDTFDSFRSRTGHAILERYGMTETGMNTSNPLDGARLAGSVGLPLPGVSVRVADEHDSPLPPESVGAIQVKGPNVFRGYWRMPEKTREEFTADGYFRTGDVGKFDAAGYLSIMGRSKDLVITGGYNVYPKEIELLIDQMPEVLESAVIGVPHPDFGEAVTAVVVTRPGAAIAADEIIDRLKREIANYKVPKRVQFIEDLPRNAMGKVQKSVLRGRFASR
jgi:malonyl-CoA/methylmalonyl-CoA synthetase